MSVHIMAMAFVHTMQKVENILRPSGLQLMGQRVSYLQAIPSQEQGAGEDLSGDNVKDTHVVGVLPRHDRVG